MRDLLHEPGLTEADVEHLRGELALDGRQVPFLAIAGHRVVLANGSLLALFGVADLAGLGARLQRNDPGARRLLQLALDMPVGSAPRLERLRFFFGHSAEPLTFICRAVMRGGERLLAAAALNHRAPAPAPVSVSAPSLDVVETADAPRTPPPAAVEAEDAGDLAALRQRLSARFPGGRVRFVWRGDRTGRIVEWEPVFAEAVGVAAVPAVGQDLPALAATWGLDPEGRLTAAMRGDASWTLSALAWPVAGEAASLPVDLGAVPHVAAEGQPNEMRGFGIAHVDRLAAAPRKVFALAVPAAAEPLEEPMPTAADFQAVETSKVVPLRRTAAPRHLSTAEESAFQEIALLLAGAGGEEADSLDAIPPASTGEADDLRALLDGQTVGLLVSREDRPIYANRAFLDLVGRPDEASLMAAGHLSTLFDGEMLLAHDGTKVPVEIDRRQIGWGGAPAQLSEVRPKRPPAAEATTTPLAARGEGEAQELAAILDTASDGVVLLDEGGRVLAINRTGEALFGHERSEVVGRRFDMLIAPESRAVAQHYLEGRTASGVKGLLNDGCEVVGLARQGGSFPLFMTVSAFGDGERKYCALLRDMTHFRKVERDLEDARREAERASAAKSDFLAKVSHEIRTPLNAIIGFAEVIMDERLGSIGNERYRDYLRDIHASGTHVMSLVNDLLDLSKIDAGKMELRIEPLDLNKVVTGCISIMQVQANRERVIVRQALTANLPHVQADERAVKQIVLNILSNALKFNEPGGQVIVATTMAEAGHTIIRVRDTGIGMSDAEIAVALEPFRTIASARPNNGTGLGLPLTKALVEANGAMFAIKSRKGEGTLVEIAFPPA